MSMWSKFQIVDTENSVVFTLYDCSVGFRTPSPAIGPDNLTIRLPAGKTARIVLEEALNKTVI